MPYQNQYLLNWLQQQFQISLGKPDFIRGAWMLLVLSGPLAVGFFLGQPKISAIPTIAAFLVEIVPVSGAYRHQVTARGIATVGITLALLIANLVSGSFWLAIITTFVVIFLLALASLFGSAMTSASFATSIMFVIALARFSSFPNLTAVLEQCLFCFTGGLWAMALSSALWIVRPHTPVVQAVADCYLTLSKLAHLVGEKTSRSPKQEDWIEQFWQAQDAVTQNLASARSIWTSIWTREKAESPRGNQLLASIEGANQTINSLVAVVELKAIALQNPLFNHLQPETEQVIEQVAISLQRFSTALKKNRNFIPLEDLQRSIKALEYQWQRLRNRVYEQTIEIQADEYASLVNLRKIVTSLVELAQQIQADAKIATDLTLSYGRSKRFFSTPEPISWLDTIKSNFTFRSVTLRHALRLAVVVTIAQLIANVSPIPKGYWITLTAMIALKPNFGGTFQRTVQRVLGTVVGGMIGISLALAIHNPLEIALTILLLMFTAVSLRSLSYSLFITLLTPIIILLLNTFGVGNWQLGIARIADSLIGGLLALLGSYLLFPSWERQRLPAQLEQTIRANLAYFQVAIDEYLHREDRTSESSLPRLRHQAALENANAEAAAQRLFSEPRHVRGEIEPVITLMLYIRSLFISVTTLTEHSRKVNGVDRLAEVEQLTEAIEQVLDNLADTLNGGQKLLPLPPLDEYLLAISDRIKQLHTARISEIATHLTATTTLQAVRTHTPVATELNQIVRAVTIMHCTIDRI
ncbi:FUSC family protein [Pleurocapsa sp. FMAR1]|uniref:FUSC family protein n=1 Tax=Pleurocapsa sp. FMAR1 TaxID=3040204 RepID=UPI0029C60D17|nr:FUSC family protein [Pleurocapsa sp. FMAR1]